jgi:hypothetical protein
MPRVCRRAAAVAALATATALIAVVPANASKPAAAKDRKALTAAVHATHVAGVNKVPRSHYKVTGQRVSTVSKSWAIAELVARPAFRSTLQGATALAIKLAGTAQWVVVDLGTADVGCGIAPNKVLADLFKTKTPCPSGSGIG